MREVTDKQNIIFQLISWYFGEAPLNILKGWKNFLLFNLNYFSVTLLLKTFFLHWRKYVWVYPKGFEIGGYIETFLSNLISRLLGAAVRSILIVIGLVAEVLIFLVGLIVFIGWLILPILLILGIYYGFRILF